LPDSMKVITLLGKWCNWVMQLCSCCSGREEIRIWDFGVKLRRKETT
jgi:hypothetical protein